MVPPSRMTPNPITEPSDPAQYPQPDILGDVMGSVVVVG